MRIVTTLYFLPNVSRSFFCTLIGLTCAFSKGVPMVPSNPNFTSLVSKSVCCPKSCGDRCNDCYGNVALQPHTCSVKNQNFCELGTGGADKCCALSIPKNRLCRGNIDAPCRLCKFLLILMLFDTDIKVYY